MIIIIHKTYNLFPVDTFLRGVRSAGAIVEASIAQKLISSEDLASVTEGHTPHQQLRALFHAVEKGPSEAKAAFYRLLSLNEDELVAIFGEYKKIL